MSPILSQLDFENLADPDYIIVGGGTAGCVVASRLAEYLPSKSILMIEAGPSDLGDRRVSDLKNWIDLLGTELDYDYPGSVESRGNNALRHSRAKMLGGCSSHNGCVSLHTFEYDCRRFQSEGCEDWSFDTFKRLIAKSRLTYQTVDPTRQNPLLSDWIKAASDTFGVPIIEDINEDLKKGNITGGAGYMPISYDITNGDRVSASTSYIHPILKGEWRCPNLNILLDAWVSNINVDGDNVTGVTLKLGEKRKVLRHKIETILCAGAIDSPRLMMLSGLGPQAHLEQLDIQVMKDIPGIGQNLQDHIETNVVWELKKPAPEQTVTYSDVFLYLRREQPGPRNLDGDTADIMFHCYTTSHLPNLDGTSGGSQSNPLVMMPNVPRPRSRGCLTLKSSDPTLPPNLDFNYFTDAKGYDEKTVVDGVRLCRQLAETSPFKDWIAKEIAPGKHIQSKEEISEFARRNSTTLFHPCGTTKMGDIQKDPLAVVDSKFKVRGLRNLRIADAGTMPVLTSTNPVLTVIAVAERAAELIAGDTVQSVGAPFQSKSNL